MSNNPDEMLIEQRSPQKAIGGSDSRRLLMWAQMDLMAGTEVSTARRLGAWLALGITFITALMLLLGY